MERMKMLCIEVKLNKFLFRSIRACIWKKWVSCFKFYQVLEKYDKNLLYNDKSGTVKVLANSCTYSGSLGKWRKVRCGIFFWIREITAKYIEKQFDLKTFLFSFFFVASLLPYFFFFPYIPTSTLWQTILLYNTPLSDLWPNIDVYIRMSS